MSHPVNKIDVENIPIEKTAELFFKGTCEIVDLVDLEVIPILMGQVSRSESEQAVAGTYYRMTLLVRTIKSLSCPSHFQTVQMTARTLFELLLDIKILSNFPSMSKQFFMFTDVSKFHKATQLVTFLDQNPIVDRKPYTHAEKFSSDLKRRIRYENDCKKYWGSTSKGKPKWPEHWTGKSIADRAQMVGLKYLEIYRSAFFLQSYYIHSGLAGIQNLSQDALISAFAIAQEFIQNFIIEATEIVCDLYQIFGGKPDLRNKLERARVSTGRFAWLEWLEMSGNEEKPSPTVG